MKQHLALFAAFLLAALPLVTPVALIAADQPVSQTSEANEATKPAHLVGALSKNEPQAIYADDPRDSWNRIFHCLFTRTLKVRLSEEFPEGAPFSNGDPKTMVRMKVSERIFERIESGDHAIEPLYPHEHFRVAVSAAQLLDEPNFSRIHGALTDALAEEAIRAPLDRALMQCDLWAAYDFLARDVTAWILKDAPIALFHERQAKLRKLLAPLIRKLALTPQEVKTLPDNYAAAGKKLPDIFSPTSEWMEVQWFPDRGHELAAMHRRATRVFIKPLVKPVDKLEFLKGGRSDNFYEKVEATALVIQNLLVTADGNVVPSPLTYDVQTRTLGGTASAKSFEMFELSRRELWKNPVGSGLMDVTGHPAYHPGAGNDYSYAAPISSGGSPIAVRSATRCAACHDAGPIFTFGIGSHAPPDAPAIRLLAPTENERAMFVANAKMKTEEFKRLMADWK